MASIRITSNRNDDNSTRFILDVPARRNGEVNFGVIAKINQVVLPINPDAFDPPEVPHTLDAPMPPHDSGIGQALAERQHDAAEAGNPLNTGDTTGPGEV